MRMFNVSHLHSLTKHYERFSVTVLQQSYIQVCSYRILFLYYSPGKKFGINITLKINIVPVHVQNIDCCLC